LSTIHTVIQYHLSKREKSELMIKTKLCHLPCRCPILYMIDHDNIVEEIDDDFIYPSCSLPFYYLYKGGDLCTVYIGI
jgi:hypothetical protein